MAALETSRNIASEEAVVSKGAVGALVKAARIPSEAGQAPTVPAETASSQAETAKAASGKSKKVKEVKEPARVAPADEAAPAGLSQEDQQRAAGLMEQIRGGAVVTDATLLFLSRIGVNLSKTKYKDQLEQAQADLKRLGETTFDKWTLSDWIRADGLDAIGDGKLLDPADEKALITKFINAGNRSDWLVAKAKELGIEIPGAVAASSPPIETFQETFNRRLADGSITVDELQMGLSQGLLAKEKLTGEQIEMLRAARINAEAPPAGLSEKDQDRAAEIKEHIVKGEPVTDADLLFFSRLPGINISGRPKYQDQLEQAQADLKRLGETTFDKWTLGDLLIADQLDAIGDGKVINTANAKALVKQIIDAGDDSVWVEGLAKKLGVEIPEEGAASSPPIETFQETFNRRLANGSITADELLGGFRQGWLVKENLTGEQIEKLRAAGKDLVALGIEQAPVTPATKEETRLEKFRKRLEERVKTMIDSFKKESGYVSEVWKVDKKIAILTAFTGLFSGAAPGLIVGYGAGYLAAITGPFGWLVGGAVGIGGFAAKKYLERKYLLGENGFLNRRFTERAKKVRKVDELTEQVKADVKGYFAIFDRTQTVGYALGSIYGGSLGREAGLAAKKTAPVKIEAKTKVEPTSQPKPTPEKTPTPRRTPSAAEIKGKPLEVQTTGQAPWVDERIITEGKEALKAYKVVNGDTFSGIVDRFTAGDTYGEAFRNFFLRNQKLFLEKPGIYGKAAKELLDYLSKNPNAVPRGANKAVFELFMKAAHLINPGDIINY